VYQLAVLENGFDQSGIPQGVVLATVGVEGESQEHEIIKSIRMYNLSSLTSLATYFATQPDARTLELSRPKDWSPQESKRTLRKAHKHNNHGSITRGIRSFRATDAMTPHSTQSALVTAPFPIHAPRPSIREPNPFITPLPRAPPRHQDSTSSTDSWDMVDDLPLRLATEYVPLATPNSRLASSSVLFFELWKNDSHGGRGTAMLAIATKTNILLYETPKGERAFRFVKVCRGARFAQFAKCSAPACACTTVHYSLTGILYTGTRTEHQFCPPSSLRGRPQSPPPPRTRHQAPSWTGFQRRSREIEIPHSGPSRYRTPAEDLHSRRQHIRPTTEPLRHL